MATTNPNNYANSMYNSGSPQVNYVDLSHSTSRPSAPISVLNPNDRTYKQFADGFNKNMLNPHQNDPTMVPRAYYTIDKAYGPPPLKTQTTRSCSGGF